MTDKYNLTAAELALRDKLDGDKLFNQRPGHYDWDGESITFGTWTVLFERKDRHRVVARTEYNDITVSTVWLGLDHGFDDGPPLIFETMVFGMDDEYMWRWSSLQEAEEGHQKVVSYLVAGIPLGAMDR